MTAKSMLRELLIILVVTPLLSAASPSQAAEARQIQVLDAVGKPVTLDLPIRRAVVLNTDAIEVLRILGSGHVVAGTSSLIQKEPLFFPEFQGLPDVGKWNDPDAEAIVALMPDLVICYGHSPGASLEAKVGSLGIKILRLDFFRPSTILEEIQTLGRVVGKKDRAEEFVIWCKEKQGAVRRCVEASGYRPRVYMEAYSDFKASGPGTAMDELCQAAGGLNIAREARLQNPEITTEWVFSQSPEVVVKAGSVKQTYGADTNDEIAGLHARMLARTGWEMMPAVQNHRMHVLSAPIGPGPRSVVGMTYLAKWFHPDACGCLHPEAVHADYLERFQGLPLRGHHVFP